MAVQSTSCHDFIARLILCGVFRHDLAMQQLSHPLLRTTGVALAAVIVFFLDVSSDNVVHQLWLPLALALAAYLMTQALMAVAIATFALATAHSDLASTDWIVAQAYPGIAATSLLVCCAIGVRRFKNHIEATHDARWAHRNTPKGAADDNEQP